MPTSSKKNTEERIKNLDDKLDTIINRLDTIETALQVSAIVRALAHSRRPEVWRYTVQ